MVGKPLDPDAVARRVTALYGRGGLDTLDYRVVGDDDRYGLALDARPSSQGPNYMRFGLSLQDDFAGQFHLQRRRALRHVGHHAQCRRVGHGPAGRQLPRWSRPSCSCRSRSSPGWFVMPHVADVARDLVPAERTRTLLAEYRVHTFDYGVDFGRQFGNWGEIRTGVHRASRATSSSRSAIRPIRNMPELSRTPFDTTQLLRALHLRPARRHQLPAPRPAGDAAVERRSATPPASAQSSDQVTFNYIGAYSFGRDTLVLLGLRRHDAAGAASPTSTCCSRSAGSSTSRDCARTHCSGPNFGIARLLYYRQIGRGGPGYLDVPTYLGASLEVGNVWQTRSAASFGNTRKDASIFLGMDTLLGPLYIASGFDQHGNQAFYLFLGPHLLAKKKTKERGAQASPVGTIAACLGHEDHRALRRARAVHHALGHDEALRAARVRSSGPRDR